MISAADAFTKRSLKFQKLSPSQVGQLSARQVKLAVVSNRLMTIFEVHHEVSQLYREVRESSLSTHEKGRVFTTLRQSISCCLRAFPSKLRNKSSAGTGLNEIMKNCEEQSQRYTHVHQLAQVLIDCQGRAGLWEQPSSKLKSFCYNTLNSGRLSFRSLGGQASDTSMTHILTHLASFANEEGVNVSAVQDDLVFARDLSSLTDRLSTFIGHLEKDSQLKALSLESRQKLALDEVASRITVRLKKLRESSFNDGQSVLFVQGGYTLEGSAHAIGFGVGPMKSSDKLIFTVINGGMGFFHNHVVSKTKVYEKVYTDCTIDQLGADFWRGLFTFKVKERKRGLQESQSVYDYLGKVFSSNPEICGRAYTPQNLPSCSAKGPMAWLHGRLGATNSVVFRAKMAAAELNEVEKLSRDLSQLSFLDGVRINRGAHSFWSRASKAQALIEEGRQVVASRQQKVSAAL